MIRILEFADIINRYDFIDNIVRQANPSRFQVGVCVRSDQSNIASPDYKDIPYWVIGGPNKSDMLKTAWELASVLRKWKVNVLHAHHYDQAVIGWLATQLYSSTRLVIGRHYSDAIYRLPQKLKQKTLLKIENLINHAAARIIVPSSCIYEILTNRQKICAQKIDLIHYGFEPEKYLLPTKTEIEAIKDELKFDNHFVIGTFARLHEEKGHRFLLEAMTMLKDEYPNLMLLIVGEGPERSAIERQIETSKLGNNVELLGWRRDGIKIMAAVDAVVQPTLQEAFSQAMVEALWMRKPLVITDVSGAPDIIRDGENGLIVPREDSKAISKAIKKLIDDKALRERIGSSGQSYVTEHLVIDKIIGQYERSFEQAMSL
jgi:glycosyltransferase involved in cell wall biosynthesis